MKITDINFFRIIYLGFRLGPFVLVSYFLVYSMFNNDFSSLVFLGGVVLACFVAIITGNSWPSDSILKTQDTICNVLTTNTGEVLSKLPLSIVVYAYSFCYFSVPITEKKTQKENILFFLFFILLIIFELFWLFLFGCFGFMKIIVAGVIGLSVGLGWGEVVYQSDLQLVKTTNSDSCSTENIPSTDNFVCLKRVKKQSEKPIMKPPLKPA